jgi:hypothetical protein
MAEELDLVPLLYLSYELGLLPARRVFVGGIAPLLVVFLKIPFFMY